MRFGEGWLHGASLRCGIRVSERAKPATFIFRPLIYTMGIIMTEVAKKAPENNEIQKKAGWGLGTKIIVGIIGLIIVVGLLAALTLTVAVLESPAGTSFPYSTTYRVSVPDGEPIMIGSTKILVMTYEDEIVSEVDGVKEKLFVGQERIINPRNARVTALGIPLMDTDFQMTLRYLGPSGNNALFDLTVKTSKQVPELVITKLIPPSMNAVPA